MLTNQVSTTDFKGKIIYGKKMTKPMIEYANKILDVVVNGKTSRERIKEASYDLYINNAGTKKTVHPKIYFSSYYNRLGHKYRREHTSHSLRIDSGKAVGAKSLKSFLDLFEMDKGRFIDSYNSFGEKVVALFSKILNPGG